ncbi:hypothetical protein H0H92_000445 [Tricholoma furcatifolium]|nr:hypothetical protein H0H92_000445 [Tricholoma furcatifolium]
MSLTKCKSLNTVALLHEAIAAIDEAECELMNVSQYLGDDEFDVLLQSCTNITDDITSLLQRAGSAPRGTRRIKDNSEASEALQLLARSIDVSSRIKMTRKKKTRACRTFQRTFDRSKLQFAEDLEDELAAALLQAAESGNSFADVDVGVEESQKIYTKSLPLYSVLVKA